jgi:hypothetical protein
MGEVVNLRQARKRKARAEREETAAGNRALHGRSKAAREADRKAGERDRAFLDGHRRDTKPGEE